MSEPDFEANLKKSKGRWFGIGCRLYHIYLPIFAVIGGASLVIIWVAWEIVRRVVLGQPKRYSLEVGGFVWDALAFIVVATIIGYIAYLLAGRVFTGQGCATEFDQATIYPNGIPRYLEWMWVRQQATREGTRAAGHSRRRERKSSKK